jgi:DNA polymerase I-like protein with 3'-5' exonuclease and polymerase domains
MTLEEMKTLPREDQKRLFKQLSSERKRAKVVNYSATYGVGKVKLARSTGMSEKDAAQLLEGFWKMNWSVKAVADQTQVRRIGGKMWLYNPVSRFWISLRNERDAFSSLNQSTGVFCFDSWLAHCWAKGIRGVGQFHDEVIAPVKVGQEQEVYGKMKKAIEEVNQKLQLNVSLDVDPQFGGRYSEIH